jgi:dGTPase
MTPRTRRHAYALKIAPEAKSRIKLHKSLSADLIFGSSALQQIEFKGGQVLTRLGETLFGHYLNGTSPKKAALVPNEVHRAVTTTEGEAARARLLCDHLSGMTDAYALRSYKRLFDPDYGSISELI